MLNKNLYGYIPLKTPTPNPNIVIIGDEKKKQREYKCTMEVWQPQKGLKLATTYMLTIFNYTYLQQIAYIPLFTDHIVMGFSASQSRRFRMHNDFLYHEPHTFEAFLILKKNFFLIT